jgi:AraC-like DNA-binding protein
VLVLNCADGGKIEAAGSDEVVFWCFSVHFEHLFPLFTVGEVSLLQDTTESLKGCKLYPASSSVAQECHRLVEAAPPQGDVNHRSQVLRVAAAVLSAEFKNARRQRSGFVRFEDHRTQAFEELTAAQLLTLSIADMEHKFSCGQRHLNRLFHQYFGCSLASLRMELRLLKALSLLRDPSLKIIHVAEQCGFNHLGLFNACFRKRFGNSPGHWRKAPANGKNPVSDSDVGDLPCPWQATGLCPRTPKPDDRAVTAPKATSMQKSGHPGGPANAKLQESILRNIREVSAKLSIKAGSGVEPRNGH